MEELSELSNICLCITSRISTIPPNCETLEIPTLSMEAARDTFYRIYRQEKESESVNDILEQLDFHPLSITLLATVAHQNKWNLDRLSKEWASRRTEVLRTEHNKTLAAAIEFSLASPMFQGLGPDARELLGVVAFFPQGVDEKNLGWFFPDIPNIEDIFDKFCVLSVAYRSEGFVKMLAPLRDYLSPKDPLTSPLLRMIKNCYFARLFIPVNPNGPNFAETRWIISEDTNVEHLLDVLTSIDANSEEVWRSSGHFMDYLLFHKPRPVVLGPKIEQLPDNHPSKPGCLTRLSQLFKICGRHLESKRILTRTLKHWRDQGDLELVGATLASLSDINRTLGLYEEGIRQAIEAVEISQQFDHADGQAQCWAQLAQLLSQYGELDDSLVEDATRKIALLSENSSHSSLVPYHRALGHIYRSKGNTTKAVEHLKMSAEIASLRGLRFASFWSYHALVFIFCETGRSDDAIVNLELAKHQAANNAFLSAHVIVLQAGIYGIQGRFEEAESEFLRAVDAFEKLGAVTDTASCQESADIIRKVRAGIFNQGIASGSYFASECELLGMLQILPLLTFNLIRRGHP